MTISLVHAYDASDNTGSSLGSLAVVCTSAQVAGDINVVQVGYAWSTVDPGITSVTDTAGNTYQLVGSILFSSGNARLSTYKALDIHAAAPSANTITVTWGAVAAQFPGMMMSEVSGATDVDQYADGTGFASTSPTTSTVITQHPDTLGICYCIATGHNTASGAGWTDIAGVNPDGIGAWGEQQTFASSGASATGTTTSNVGTYGISMVILAATAANAVLFGCNS